MKLIYFPLEQLRMKWMLLIAILLSLDSAMAQIAYSSTRGIYTVKVPGASQATAPVRTYLGIQLMQDARYKGTVSNVSGNALSFQSLSNYSFIADPTRKCFIHVLTGSGRGFVTDIEQYRTNDIVCAENLTPWIQPGTEVRIRPHPNIINIFGVTNKFGLAATTDADTADNVVVWDPNTQQERVYYFHSTRARWEEKGIVADAGLASFRFPYGFYIVRRSPGTLRIALSGDVGSDAILLPVRSAANVFSLPVNLSASLETIVRSTGNHAVISGENSKGADILTFEEPTTGMQRGPFYYLSKPGAMGWREVGVNDSTAPIQPLDYLSTLILRREGNPSLLFVEGDLTPPTVPRPQLPPDPEPGEIPLTGELQFPRSYRPDSGVLFTIEVSIDLQTWNDLLPNRPMDQTTKVVSFDLPSGQRRAFYRARAQVINF